MPNPPDIILTVGRPNPPDIGLGPLTNWGWIGPFSDPVRTPDRLSVAARSTFFSFVPVVAPVVAVALDWFVAFSNPPAYQVEPGLSAAWTQYITGVTIPRSDKLDYFQPFSDPPRPKPDIKWRDPFTTDWKWTAPTAVTVTADSWYRLLSEPQRVKADIRWREAFVTDWKWEAPPEVDWRTPLSEPVRSKPDIRFREPYTTDWKWEAPPEVDWR